MKFAVSIATPEVVKEPPLALLEGTFEEKLSKARSFGYDGVELVVSHPDALDAGALCRLLQGQDLQAASVASGCIAQSRGLTLLSSDKEVRAAAMELLLGLIDLAARVGAPVVTLGSFKGKADSVGGTASAKDMLFEILRRADSLASSCGVTIALEYISRFEADMLLSAAETAEYIAQIDLPSVKLLFDTYHMFLTDEDERTVYMYADILGHVHIADSDRLPAGCGKVDFAAVEKALSDVKYSGWQSAELKRGEAPDRNAALTIENIKRIL